MIKQIILAAAAVAALGTSIAGSAQEMRRDRMEMRHDRQELRHDRRDFRHDRRAVHGRYFWHGHYYQNRCRHHGQWMYR